MGTGVPGGEETAQDKGSRMTQVGRGICLTNQGAKEEGQAGIQLIPVPPHMSKEVQSNACCICGPVQLCQQELGATEAGGGRQRQEKWESTASLSYLRPC